MPAGHSIYHPATGLPVRLSGLLCPHTCTVRLLPRARGPIALVVRAATPRLKLELTVCRRVARSLGDYPVIAPRNASSEQVFKVATPWV